ncbi:MAG: hypothetical protein V1789_06965 [PVC group bacterium]
MKSRLINAILCGTGIILLAGCADTYHQDCRIRLESEPSGAEIWKNDYFIGLTPHTLVYTATAEDDDRGYLPLPPLLLKKEGYQPCPLEIRLDLEKGYDWEGMVELEQVEKKSRDADSVQP